MNIGEFHEYQTWAFGTAVYPDQGKFMGLVYCSLKLAGEAGEFSEKVGKIIRDDGSRISLKKREELGKELGDVLWYIANAAGELGFSLKDIAEMNRDKLNSRKERGVLHGSGDNR